MSYDAFATTFSNSRKNLHWPELEYIIANMQHMGYTSILDIGCGNGRFIEEAGISGFQFGEYLGIDSSEGMIGEARKLHPDHRFEVVEMRDLLTIDDGRLTIDSFLFLASFHHLASKEERTQVLENTKKLLKKNGRIYMTNWNLSDQLRYEKSHRGDGDYDIKIGQYSRYYHGFTQGELAGLFEETGYRILENRIFDGGRNILSILEPIV